MVMNKLAVKIKTRHLLTPLYTKLFWEYSTKWDCFPLNGSSELDRIPNSGIDFLIY